MIRARALVALAALVPLAAFPVAAGAQEGETAEAPACDTLAMGQGRQDCTLRTEERVLGFAYDEDSVEITQTDGEGVPAGEPILIETDDAANHPLLRDLSGDGRPELLVPTGSGMVNVTYAVLTATPEGAYAPVGQLTSVGANSIELKPDGSLVTYERDTAAAHVETAHVWTATGLATAWALHVDLAERDCTLLEGAQPELTGTTAEAIISECEAQEWP
ncbi:hypothetical protein [Wenxinia saemankumensis]|uniref:Repeat domain-containing protein n=1 Tax=Wenxinia saemankumensis TaxID=1447782 RepID=A0A1M6EAS0_9RHOB|nr:hypothetical protein [Wenxinia saemankumensis]SHI82469.1 hypothetical protein SAMN05444417_1902 [Wenxinia saemankumensis]